ncbi:hypothetical protein HELRODRAFT_114301 [Helobdella robusta]|uniref:NOT2/NOT3/NOT5 C-terminal domain-containing protein n=1 Tax=Helobdella robusta TaxID=6412 RepID=T1EG07_HELRO|nr:hypothetical protein HELRODRAFT_114301 [Helobdella robusta]ESN97225.1 hypothetical protein HELRODRAFT_114301 [Helobdella robusta]
MSISIMTSSTTSSSSSYNILTAAADYLSSYFTNFPSINSHAFTTTTSSAATTPTFIPATSQQQQSNTSSTATTTTTTTTMASSTVAAAAASTTTTIVTTTTIKIDPMYSLTPLGRVPLTKQQLYQMQMLSSASLHMPHAMESQQNRSTNFPMPYKMPSYYATLPPSLYNHLDFYLKLNPETLFFIFYYMEGSKAQYMAAKALKQLSWRFHTRHLMWFQRRDEPTLITEECEQGSYIYFDYEKWMQRNVDNFTFEYKYLEDKDLS